MSRINSLSAALFLLCGCLPPSPTFDDHTVPSLDSVAHFEQRAVGEHGRQAVKFVITGFGTERAQVRYADGHFFTLHDEWYWFRLLNGQRIPGREGITPVEGLSFASVQDIYGWAKAQQTLPLDLTWVDDARLYSPRFYTLALDVKPRAFGLGTLLRVAAEGARPERWAFHLEYTDALSHAELVQFFEHVDASVPAAVSGQTFWVVRSPQQEALARDIQAQRLRFHDRILRMKDLAAQGELEVYNGGLTAGRVRIIRSGEAFADTSPDELLVLEDVPDFLPPAAGVITAVPQTPLAHFNLLAKNRGIPNAYQGGVLADLALQDYARLRTPVVLKATVPGELVLKPLTEAQFATWKQLQAKPPVAVAQVDAATLPLSHDLRALRLADADALRPSIGGKATGYLALLAATPDATPDQLEAITIRPYVEHLAPFRARVEAMLADAAFEADARVRYLALEGEAKFLQTHPAEAAFVEAFLAARPSGDVVGDLARAGGLRGALRAAPMHAATLAALTQTLSTRFAHFAVTQGLRFRSSSTAEDVEGFNGAGLYESSTGFLDAAAQPASSDRKQTVEWALKKTWASYWSFEAFEERRLERVDHLSGNMAVVVHARFDDARERSNGVFLLTLQEGAVVMDLNVQSGALSVTNPTSTELPEVTRVWLPRGGTSPVIERLRASTVVPAGTQVLTDAQLLETFSRATAVAERWLQAENGALAPAQRARSLVLDFEFRHVAEGWPALKSGLLPSRIVLKQARSLEPGLRGVSAEVQGLPLPRDVLKRALRVERRTCETPLVRAEVVEALTDPAVMPDLGFSALPFTASVRLTFKEPDAVLGVAAGEVVDADHLALREVLHRELPARWSLEATLPAQVIRGLELREGRAVLRGVGGEVESPALSCRVEVLRATPAEYLVSLL